jgi:chromosome segregation ATPase
MAVVAGVTAVAVVGGSFLVAGDLSGRSDIRSADVSLATAVHQLGGLRAQLTRAEDNQAQARARRAGVTRSFDAAQTSLTATQSALSKEQADVHSEGVDLGKLDSCLSAVEEALNQIAVGQTAGGLGSLRASSSSCAALSGAG